MESGVIIDLKNVKNKYNSSMYNRQQVKQLPSASYDEKGERIPGSGFTPNEHPNRKQRRKWMKDISKQPKTLNFEGLFSKQDDADDSPQQGDNILGD